MDFIFIDYSEVYFKAVAKAAIPMNRSDKFVQIRNTDTDKEYLVLSPKELSVYHANIIERFCLLNELKGEYKVLEDDLRQVSC